MVDGRVEIKPSTAVTQDQAITFVNPPTQFVSRSAEKLAHAITVFQPKIGGTAALDIGASTGGFTQCLLSAGAASVMAVDVGHGQMNSSLMHDPRVTLVEGFNARNITAASFEHTFGIIVIDVSFISLTLILPAATNVLASDGTMIALIKPQFEVGSEFIGKNGIVNSPLLRDKAIANVRNAAVKSGLTEMGITDSPILGGDGNKEFLIYWNRTPKE